MSQSKYLKEADKIYDIIQKTHEKKLDFWLENVLFTWQWWLGVILAVVPWILWIKYRKKESTYRLLTAGFLVIIICSWLDFVGISLGLWHYNYDVLPLLPSYLPWDFTLFPVIIMFLIQFKPRMNPFIKAFIFGGATAFIGEPIFTWIKAYDPEQWKYIYSFPFFIVIYMLAHLICTRTDFKSLKP